MKKWWNVSTNFATLVVVTDSGRWDKEIKVRVDKANSAFKGMGGSIFHDINNLYILNVNSCKMEIH